MSRKTRALLGCQESSAPPVSEQCHPFFRPWHKKGCKEDRVTRMRLHNLSTSTTLASNTSLASFLGCVSRESAGTDLCVASGQKPRTAPPDRVCYSERQEVPRDA